MGTFERGAGLRRSSFWWWLCGAPILSPLAFFKGAQTMKCKLWTETLQFWRLNVSNSRFALHGLAPPKFTVCAPFLPLIHGLCAFFRLLLTPLSTAPSPPSSQFTVCTSWFARLRFFSQMALFRVFFELFLTTGPRGLGHPFSDVFFFFFSEFSSERAFFREMHFWEHFGQTERIALITCLKHLNVSGAFLIQSRDRIQFANRITNPPKSLSGTGDSQPDSRGSIRANHSQLKPQFL